MNNRNIFITFDQNECHKGFYNDSDPEKSLYEIGYSDFFQMNEDDDFPFDTAHELLCGACCHFALSLKEVFNYEPYIVKEKNDVGFHAFCKVYYDKKWYYIDARGITSCFSEVMKVAKRFVTKEYIIRPVNSTDIEEWDKGFEYSKEAYAFSEAVIKHFGECYSF